MTLRDQVVAAFETGDQGAVLRLGWWPVWEALATWWAPRQTCNAKETVPYAKLLGDENPDKVLEALRDLTGEWRPSPAAIHGRLHRTDDESKVDVGRGRDVYLRDEAVQAVVEALQAGEQVCTCGTWHPSRFRPDASRVLRCRTCCGIEQGQVYAAEDAEGIPDHDVDGYAESVPGQTQLLTPGGARA